MSFIPIRFYYLFLYLFSYTFLYLLLRYFSFSWLDFTESVQPFIDHYLEHYLRIEHNKY